MKLLQYNQLRRCSAETRPLPLLALGQAKRDPGVGEGCRTGACDTTEAREGCASGGRLRLTQQGASLNGPTGGKVYFWGFRDGGGSGGGARTRIQCGRGDRV